LKHEKTFMGQQNVVGTWGPKVEHVKKWVTPTLNIHNLDLQSLFFNITMISSSQATMSFP
jgi:hypothetical protein